MGGTKTIRKLVPDTSVIIEGLVSEKIVKKDIKPETIIIHEAVLSELEHQANQNRETGFLGIEEIKKLRNISKKYRFKLQYSGKRPEAFEIKFAKSGEIDSLIRGLAHSEKATLMTADKVQALIAESKGINVYLIEFEIKPKKLAIEKYFDSDVMSVHLRENVAPFAKRGRPGRWDFLPLSNKAFTREEVRDMAKEIVEETAKRSDGFIEIQRKGSTIIQIANYRIVITKPPFSDGWEITAVRPIVKLTMNDYKIGDKLKRRVEEQAEGILIAGAPGHGKTTFAQALAEYYASKNKVVKTVEAPRDLQLPDTVTQYAISHGSPQEMHDILLLSRPDYTIFDEMRNTEDFRLFADLRLSGVGMVGVLHATNPIDAIQRFVGRIELGVIPQVIDTVIFIKEGKIHKVFSLRIEVKVPSGMMEADLARPVITVTDFDTGKIEFEMYTYGEETVVIPVKAKTCTPVQGLAAKSVEKEFKNYSDMVNVDMVSDNKCIVYVPSKDIPKVIGKKGETIEKIEKKLGVRIDVQELSEKKFGKEKKSVDYNADIDKKNIIFFLDPGLFNRDVDIVVNNDYLLTAKVGKKGKVRIRKNNKIGKIIVNAINSGEKVELMV